MRILIPAWRLFQRLLMLVGALFLLVTCTPLVYWWATALAGPWDDPKGDVLIVLTGSGMEDGIIGESSYWRAIYAIRAYHAREISEILITGGASEVPPVAETMRKFMIGHGIPGEAIRVEVASNSTRTSGVNVERMIAAEPGHYKNRRLVLLTSDYHMYRSTKVFAKAGVQIAPRPIPDIRKRYGSVMDRCALSRDLAEETVKIVYYRLQGWI